MNQLKFFFNFFRHSVMFLEMSPDLRKLGKIYLKL